MNVENPAQANQEAIALRAQGRLNEAIALFRRALEAHPRTLELRQNLAQALYEAGDTQGAIAEHRTVLAADPRNVASHLTMYELLQITGERTLALAHQRLALEEQRVFTQIAPHEQRAVLVVCAPGDWQANIPVDFLLDPNTTSVIKLYLVDEGRLVRETLPRYDVSWNAIAESRENVPYLRLASRLLPAQHVPYLNDPVRVFKLSRQNLPSILENTGARVPPVAEISFDDLSAGKLPFGFPSIARPMDSHAGHGLERLDDAAACKDYASRNEANAYVTSPFVDYSSADGYFRKYRIVFVDGEPFAVHLAISDKWMIHYYNALMAEHAWMRAEEEAFMEDLQTVFDGPRFETLKAIAAAVGLEYFGIDCAIDRDGRVLVFEADPAMLVHTTDPVDLYPYKHRLIPQIYRAVERMLDRRKHAHN
jgi:tetratricopeptide (TPR) repeat protein